MSDQKEKKIKNIKVRLGSERRRDRKGKEQKSKQNPSHRQERNHLGGEVKIKSQKIPFLSPEN